MRNQTEGKTKNNTATFRPKEDESAIVMDSRIDHIASEYLKVVPNRFARAEITSKSKAIPSSTI
jgi:hypothetical protein